MNVLMHGSDPTEAPRVAVSLTLSNSGVTLAVEDDGAPFDPLSLPAPDVTASLEGRRVGGLGVFLVLQVMDSVSYQRRGTRNQLRMTKNLIGIKKSHV
jgi:serine/threonine-protein kinase RsbW